MKLIPIPAILISLIFNSFAHAKEVPQTSIPGIRNEILQIQGLKKTQDLGTFGLIIDEMFFWFTDNIDIRKYVVEKIVPAIAEDNKVLNSGIAVILLRDKNGVLKKVVYDNKYLFPLDTRHIEIDFSNENFTSVRMKFTTFYGNIEKDIILQFKKGESRPVKNIDNALYYGEADIVLLQKEFAEIQNKIIRQDFINPKQDKLGSLGKMVESFFRFKDRIKKEDIFIVYSQRIKNAPLQEMRADCFFIASNLSLLILYDSRLEISAVYKISRLDNVLKFESISFINNGIQIANVRYDADNFRLEGVETYHFPYGEIEPRLFK